MVKGWWWKKIMHRIYSFRSIFVVKIKTKLDNKLGNKLDNKLGNKLEYKLDNKLGNKLDITRIVIKIK
jgi:hypothetical protein